MAFTQRDGLEKTHLLSIMMLSFNIIFMVSSWVSMFFTLSIPDFSDFFLAKVSKYPVFHSRVEGVIAVVVTFFLLATFFLQIKIDSKNSVERRPVRRFTCL